MQTYLSSIDTIVHQAPDAEHGWQALLRQASKFHPTPCLKDISHLPMADAVQQTALRLSMILARAPIPTEIEALYFGLHDHLSPDGTATRIGYAVSGIVRVDTGAEGLYAVAYAPADNHIDSDLLNSIRRVAQARTRNGDGVLLNYYVIHGAAALMTRFALAALGIPHTAVVGFDEGDHVVVN